jgi:hypothetical protein
MGVGGVSSRVSKCTERCPMNQEQSLLAFTPDQIVEAGPAPSSRLRMTSPPKISTLGAETRSQ